MVRVGVVGYGYWGPNLVRNFHEVPGCTVRWVCDLNPATLGKVAARYPTTKTTTDVRELWIDHELDAVVIATPVATHAALARAALEAGKHVLVEKPLTHSAAEARALVALARERRRLLMVDHTFLYTGAVRRLREMVRSGELGDIYYYDSVRINLGIFQNDVSVVWDLASHDLSIIDYVLPHRAAAVSANGLAHFPGQPLDMAYLSIKYHTPPGTPPLMAHVHVNWLAPVKLRRAVLGASRKMVVYDELEPSEKLRVYDRGMTMDSRDRETVHGLLMRPRTGDLLVPHLDTTEALAREARHFVACINGTEQPIADGEQGLRVVELLEAADASLAANGAWIALGGEASR